MEPKKTKNVPDRKTFCCKTRPFNLFMGIVKSNSVHARIPNFLSKLRSLTHQGYPFGFRPIISYILTMAKNSGSVLTINTTYFEKAEVGLKTVEGRILESKKFAAGRKLSQKLLLEIDRLLKENKLKPQDLSAIEVNPVPGSFTGTRIGVAVANAFGFSLGIPVNDQEIAMPVYSSPPKITPQP